CIRSIVLDRMDDQERAIEALREGLAQIEPEAEPQLFSMLQSNLAKSLTSRSSAAVTMSPRRASRPGRLETEGVVSAAARPPQDPLIGRLSGRPATGSIRWWRKAWRARIVYHLCFPIAAGVREERWTTDDSNAEQAIRAFFCQEGG